MSISNQGPLSTAEILEVHTVVSVHNVTFELCSDWMNHEIFRRIKVFNMPVHHGVKTFVWGRKASMIDYVRNSSRCSVSWWRGECQKAEWLLPCIICEWQIQTDGFTQENICKGMVNKLSEFPFERLILIASILLLFTIIFFLSHVYGLSCNANYRIIIFYAPSRSPSRYSRVQ